MNKLPKVGDTIQFGHYPIMGGYEIGNQFHMPNGDLVHVYPSYLNKERIREGVEYVIDKINFVGLHGYLDARHYCFSILVSKKNKEIIN